MRRIGKFRPFLVVALSVLCFGLPGNSSSTPENSFVWFSDHRSLKAIDTETHQFARSVPLRHAPDALAVDPANGHLWALMGSRLLKFSPEATEVLDIDLGRLRPGIDRPNHLALDPHGGAVWIAGGREVIKLSAEGQPLTYWRAPKPIEALALDIDESLWVLAHRELHHLSSAGAVRGSVNLATHLLGTERLAIDSLAGIIWIADRRRLLKLNLGLPPL